jgi:hypothetical protein
VAAERVVETVIGQNRLAAIIVHPTAPIGPRDQKPTPTGRAAFRVLPFQVFTNGFNNFSVNFAAV